MHRDTRLAELIGEAVVMRSTDPETGGEIIRQHNRPGGVLTSDLCVLDDISRAPGESLNVLLRILNERKIGDTPIPLRSAIATSVTLALVNWSRAHCTEAIVLWCMQLSCGACSCLGGACSCLGGACSCLVVHAALLGEQLDVD